MTQWWRPVLDTWSMALEIPYTAVQDAAVYGDLGRWQKSDDRWSLLLDGGWVALMNARKLTPEVRSALTWTLQVTAQSLRKSWQQTVRDLFLKVASTGPIDGLAFDAHAEFERQLPGYFVWIQPTRRHAQANDALETKQGAEAVLRALVDEGFVGWLHDGAEGQIGTALLYWPATLSQGDGASAVLDTDVSAAYALQERVKRDIRNVLAELEAETFLSATAAIGRMVRQSGEVTQGLRTVWTAWRTRGMQAKQTNVVSWGDTPIEHLLISVPEDGHRLFEEIAAVKSRQGDVRLSAELEEALEGVVAANLNVSEAARLLYLHRNTLLHRIDRIREQTGYDVRNFRDALVLWLMLALQRRHLVDQRVNG